MDGPKDLIVPAAKGLLLCLEGTLDRYDAGVCRSFLAPGGPPAWDTCCRCDATHEGQAWVQIQQIGPTENFPTIQTGPMRCHPPEHAVQLNVAILRCASTVDDGGDPPAASTLTGEFEKVQRDRAIIDEAMTCCYLPSADPGTYTIGVWTPLGPSGGCVGGQRTLTLAVKRCGCPPPDEES